MLRSCRLRNALVCVLSVAVLSGCTYTQDRLRDFSDIVWVGGGVGIGGNARATNYLQGGLGLYGDRFVADLPALVTFGLARPGGVGRTFEGPHDPAAELGLAPLFFFRANEYSTARKHGSVMFFKTHTGIPGRDEYERWYDSRYWTFFPGVNEFRRDYDRRFFEIGLSAYLLLGLDLSADPYELVDFLLGLATIDIASDDTSSRLQAESAPGESEQELGEEPASGGAG